LIGEIHCTHHLIHFTHSLLLNLIVSCVSFVCLCTIVDVFQIIVSIFCLVFLAGPFVLYVPFCSCDLFCMSCLSCVSSLSFNSMIRRIWNPLWNCHTAVVYSSGLIPSMCNTVSVFTAYSSASSHSSAVVDSIFVESLKACNSNLIGYSCHCKSCRYSVTLQWIHCSHHDAGFNVAELDSVVLSSVVYIVCLIFEQLCTFVCVFKIISPVFCLAHSVGPFVPVYIQLAFHLL